MEIWPESLQGNQNIRPVQGPYTADIAETERRTDSEMLNTPHHLSNKDAQE